MAIFGRLRTSRRPLISLDRDPYLEGLARQLLRLRAGAVRPAGPRL